MEDLTIQFTMKTIEKKIFPTYFKDILSGDKTFELRKDEDDIQVGDAIILKEYDGVNYTGNQIIKNVKYVLRNVPQHGLLDGYCIIGIS